MRGTLEIMHVFLDPGPSYAKEMGCYTGCPYDQETDDDLDDVLEIKGS